MPEAGPPRAPSHTSTTQWQSFEVRMRRRRVTRCVLRAEVALEAGFPADARGALAEARRLDPNQPLDELEARIEAASVAPPQPARTSGNRPLVAVAAALVLAVLTALLLIPASEPQDAAATAAPASERPAPARLPVVGISERLVTPDVITGLPDPQSRPSPSSSLEPPARTFSAAPSRQAPADSPARAAAPAMIPTAPLLLRTTGVPAPAPPASEPIAPVTLGNLGAASPRADAAEPAGDPSVESASRIRAVLSQYEAAYTGLDAAAARAVWPAVDERALARAFNNLESQRISLEQCDVSVDGPSARAECRGRASWVPKVGGGGRTEARRWTFDLRQAGGGWQIVRAEAR